MTTLSLLFLKDRVDHLKLFCVSRFKWLKWSKIGVFSHVTKYFYEFKEYDQELFADVIHTLRDKGTIVKEVDILSYHRGWDYGLMLNELKNSLESADPSV